MIHGRSNLFGIVVVVVAVSSTDGSRRRRLGRTFHVGLGNPIGIGVLFEFSEEFVTNTSTRLNSSTDQPTDEAVDFLLLFCC